MSAYALVNVLQSHAPLTVDLGDDAIWWETSSDGFFSYPFDSHYRELIARILHQQGYLSSAQRMSHFVRSPFLDVRPLADYDYED